MAESLREQWEPYARLIPFEIISERIVQPKLYLREEVRRILPSVNMAKDGQIIQSLVLLTDKYICEVRFNENAVDFDVSLLATIFNFRIQVGKHEMTIEEPTSAENPSTEKKVTKIVYDSAKASLAHIMDVSTRLEFVGEGRDAWVKQVFDAIPVDLLVKQ